jgi:hypothetical protein
MHQLHHLLSTGEPWVPESEVDRVDQTVVKEALRDWKTVMKETLVSLKKLRLVGLVVESLGVIVARHKLGSFFLLELF